MFSSAHLLAAKLNGPAEGWNLANVGKGLNKAMEVPEGIAEKLKNKGAEVKYVTTAEYYGDFPPSDRNTIAAATPEQKKKWLGGLVAKSYKVAISLVKPAPGDTTKPGPIGTPVECIDPSDYLATIKLVGGPVPRSDADRLLEYATQTAESTPAGKLLPGIGVLSRGIGRGVAPTMTALDELVKRGALEKRLDGRYYLKS